jgi:putative ABC transport system permease protein
LQVVARMKPDVSFEAARSEMAAIGDRLSREVEDDRGWTATAIPLARQMTGDVRTSLLVLLAAVGLLLLIAVANVATLTLSMMRRRSRELAIRRVLGATDERLFRQVLTQGVLLGLIGSAAGLIVVQPVTRLLVALLPPDAPRLGAIQVDGRVLAITSAIAIVAAIVSALVSAARGRPARQQAMEPQPLFSQDAGDGRVAARASGLTLVTSEIAIAFALAVMAMLMARSFAELRAVDLGFTAGRVLVAKVAVTDDRYASPDSRRLFFQTLLTRVRALPGVESAGLTSLRPFGGLSTGTTVRNAQPRDASESKDVAADIRWVDSDLFRTLRVPLLRGNGFDPHTPASGPRRVVISETLARAAWPGSNPIGHQLQIVLNNTFNAEIVGVVGNLHSWDTRTPPRAVAYLLDTQFPDTSRDLVVRVDGDRDPEAIVPSLRAAVAAIDPTVPLYQVASLSSVIDRSLAPDRFTTFLLSAFAALALLLGGVGVFGVFSGEIAGRRKEMAIRMALGARASTILSMLLRQSLARVSIGLAAGALLAAILARAMASLLFGVGSTDAASFLISGVIVCILAALATVIPTVQLLRSSPLRRLHGD